MIERTWKRVAIGVAVLVLGTAGVLLWRTHRESAAKAALAAEIHAERAARARPATPVPTNYELETAALYRAALDAVRSEDIWEVGFSDAEDGVPWSEVPEPVDAMLARNAGILEKVDAATAREACRFPDPLLSSWSGCHFLRRLIRARGYASLARGSPVAAAEDVRKLIRYGRDIASTPPPGEDDVVGVWPDLQVLTSEQEASRLLAAVATAPALPPEAGPALAAAASDTWGSAEAIRRSIDVHEVSGDALLLRMLAPDGEAWLEELYSGSAEDEDLTTRKSANRSIVDRAEDLFRGKRRPGATLPTAAGVRKFREMRMPVVAAVRRRDMEALAPGGLHDATGKVFGFLGPAWFRTTLRYEARIAVARAAAGVRAFQLREGQPPRALEELVPSVLPEVPLDPFDGNPLIYEVGGAEWRVASRVWREQGMGEDESPGEPPPVEVRFPRGPK